MYRSGICRSLGLLLLSVCSLLGASAAADAQKAAYVVQSKADVDGDGRADELRIDDLGTISVAITGRTDAGAWTALAASGKVVGGSLQVKRGLDSQGRTIVLATSKLRTRSSQSYEEAVVLAWEPGKLTTLWRGPTGSLGRDGAHHSSVEIGKFGLIKYSSRQGVYRCDGETAHLDAQRFDFSRGSFRSVRQAVRVAPSPATPLLHGKSSPDDALLANAQSFWFRPQGASSSTEAASAAELVAPLALSDGDDKTAWVENTSGFGRGDFVTLKSSVGSVRIKALRFVLGHGAALGDFNRPRRMALLVGKTHKFWIEFDKDPRGAQWVQLPESVPGDCVTLVIDDVYPRSASKSNEGRTAISEISVVSEEDLDPAVAGALLASRIAQGKGGADLTRLLRAWGVTAAPGLVAAIAESKDERSRLRLRLALARIPAAADQLVAGLASETARTADRVQLRRGLEALGTAAVGELALALDSSSLGLAATQHVAEILGGIPGAKAEKALVQALGKGVPGKRAIVTRVVGKRAQAALGITAALAESEPGPRQADLYRALGLAGAALQGASPERAALADQLARALEETGLPYEVHYRLVQAAAVVGGKTLVSALVQQVQHNRDAKGEKAMALSRLAVSALAAAQVSEEGTDVEGTLKDALEHGDPGMRLAVVSHLRSAASMVPSLATRLQQDHWPEVRRAVAAALSLHCQTSTSTDALAEATRKDEDEQVALTALSALVRCQTPGLFALLLESVDNSKRPMGLRLFAARQLGAVSNRNSDDEVLKRYRRMRGLALTERDNGKIASALTVALADLASQEAVALLEDSASDPAVPELQAAALTALAKLCRPSSKTLIRDLKRSPTPSVAMAARQAASRCH